MKASIYTASLGTCYWCRLRHEGICQAEIDRENGIQAFNATLYPPGRYSGSSCTIAVFAETPASELRALRDAVPNGAGWA